MYTVGLIVGRRIRKHLPFVTTQAVLVSGSRRKIVEITAPVSVCVALERPQIVSAVGVENELYEGMFRGPDAYVRASGAVPGAHRRDVGDGRRYINVGHAEGIEVS
jgi:hypothetical protein